MRKNGAQPTPASTFSGGEVLTGGGHTGLRTRTPAVPLLQPQQQPRLVDYSILILLGAASGSGTKEPKTRNKIARPRDDHLDLYNCFVFSQNRCLHHCSRDFQSLWRSQSCFVLWLQPPRFRLLREEETATISTSNSFRMDLRQPQSWYPIPFISL